MYKKFFLVFGGVLAGLIQGVAFSQFGIFQDSEIYYELYTSISSFGVCDVLTNFSMQTLKFEPVFILILAAQSFLFGEHLTESLFIVLNLMLLNVVLACAVYGFVDKNYKYNFHVFLMCFLILSGYLVFSKNMYFWRSIYSTCFILLMMKYNGKSRVAWGLIALLTHSSSLLFLLLFLIGERVSKINRKSVYIIFFSLIMTSVFFAGIFSEYVSFAVSGGDVSVFTVAGGEHTIKVWISIFYSFFILMLIHEDYMKNSQLRAIYVFSLAAVLAALLSFNSYHFMNRIFLPASLIVGFLPFFVKRRDLKFTIAKFLVVLSVLPAIRLNYMLFFGQFSPA